MRAKALSFCALAVLPVVAMGMVECRVPAEISVGCDIPEFSAEAVRLAGLLGRVYRSAVTTNDVGFFRFRRTDWDDPQRYAISTDSDGVTLSAPSPLGASYAAASLLRRLGYRVFAPQEHWEILPDEPPRTLCFEEASTPDFKRRWVWPWYNVWPDLRKGRFAGTWNFANRMEGIGFWGGHVYQDFVRLNPKLFKDHPEYLGLVDGKRTSDKLCISNPQLRAAFADWVGTKVDKYAESVGFSVEPSDGGGWCECAECLKIGTPSDRAMTLANETARRLRGKRPGLLFRFLAYNQHSPPARVPAEPDVLVSVATLFLRDGWTFDTLLGEWRKRVRHLGVREYWYARPDFGNGPASDWRGLAAKIRKYHAGGATYLTAECDDAWAPAMLGFNVAAALLWDVSADPQAVVDDFFRCAFPRAGEPMRRFFSLIDGGEGHPLCEDTLARMFEALEEAYSQAGTASERDRVADMVRYAALCGKLLDYWNDKTVEKYAAFLEDAASLRELRLVHTLCLKCRSRDWGKAESEFASGFDWMARRPLADPRALIAAGRGRYRKMAFEPKTFSGPLRLVRTGAAARNAIVTERAGRRSCFAWSDGKPFEIEVTGGLIPHYRDRGNVKLTLVQIGGESDTGELETVVGRDSSVPPDGNARKVRFMPRHAGLHRIDKDDGGDYTRVAMPKEMPAVLCLTPRSSKFVRGTYYVAVPKGVRQFGFYLKGACEVYDMKGTRLGRYRAANGHHLIDLPFDGGVLEIRGLWGDFMPLTVPACLNLKSDVMLLPEGVEL